MTIEETKKKILEDDEFVMTEVHRLRTLYELKSVIRYNMQRTDEIDTESVAEHVYGMHILATYFLPLENENHTWKRERISALINFHDIEEVETGDVVGYIKTEERRAVEREALPKVIARLPESMHQPVTELLDEYIAQETAESQFVKAIDKVEPSFHVYREHDVKTNYNITKATYEQHRAMKDPYTQAFPVLHHFNDVLSRTLRDEGHFSE